MPTAEDAKPINVPPKREYQKGEFVDRGQALNVVKGRVKQGKRGHVIELPIINFWGIAGSGKSWFLRHLAERYRGPGRRYKRNYDEG